MNQAKINRRDLIAGGAAAVAMIPLGAAAAPLINPSQSKDTSSFAQDMSVTFTKTAPPAWLLAFWKEIDDKTFGEGFNCFAEDAICNLGVADWHGRETIRENLRAFVNKNFTAVHEVVEYWDGGSLKIFRGIVTMKFVDATKETAKPMMVHFFYMDKTDPSKVSRWMGAVGPTSF